MVGETRVGRAGEGRQVTVGTERDLVGLPPVDLAVAVDADGLILGSNYRAAEEALRVLTRLAAAVPAGHGKRLMVQTAQSTHPVLVALRRGDPMDFLVGELRQREELGFPPAGQLMVVEVRGGREDADELLRRATEEDGVVLGPAQGRQGLRWLIQGIELSPVKGRLRSVVQSLRDAGAAVRVDVDPIDL